MTDEMRVKVEKVMKNLERNKMKPYFCDTHSFFFQPFSCPCLLIVIGFEHFEIIVYQQDVGVYILQNSAGDMIGTV